MNMPDLTLNRVDQAHDTVYYEPQEGAPFQAVSDAGGGSHPTLDWATARQACGLAKDGTTLGLIWDNGVMRPKAAARRDVNADFSGMEVAWANGVIAKLLRGGPIRAGCSRQADSWKGRRSWWS